jgi:hypothetical protein
LDEKLVSVDAGISRVGTGMTWTYRKYSIVQSRPRLVTSATHDVHLKLVSKRGEMNSAINMAVFCAAAVMAAAITLSMTQGSSSPGEARLGSQCLQSTEPAKNLHPPCLSTLAGSPLRVLTSSSRPCHTLVPLSHSAHPGIEERNDTFAAKKHEVFQLPAPVSHPGWTSPFL